MVKFSLLFTFVPMHFNVNWTKWLFSMGVAVYIAAAAVIAFVYYWKTLVEVIRERWRLCKLMEDIPGPFALPLVGTTWQFKWNMQGRLFFKNIFNVPPFLLPKYTYAFWILSACCICLLNNWKFYKIIRWCVSFYNSVNVLLSFVL